MATTTTKQRAIGIVRVSDTDGREGDSFASPGDQREAIEAQCESLGLELVEVKTELDVSGGTPLARRTGLREAVEAVEAGEVDVVVAAYFDRLIRSLSVQAELLARVEAAGGKVRAADVGEIRGGDNAEAGQWLTSTFLGLVAEYQRRTTRERSATAQRRAMARGVAPFPNIPAGYRRGEDGVLQPDEHADAVRQAFELRADGATVQAVRDHLADHGIVLGTHGVTALLASRIVRGELHFGELANLQAHPAIVTEDLWKRVQRRRSQRAGGRQAPSERLLARLGVLRCAGCNARLVVGSNGQRKYPTYRCPSGAGQGDCQQRVSISAVKVEEVVIDAVKAYYRNQVAGRASAADDARRAVQARDAAVEERDAFVRAFSSRHDLGSVAEIMAEHDAAVTAAEEEVERTGRAVASLVVNIDDWDILSVGEQRGLIRTAIDSVTVAPGYSPERVRVHPFGE